MLCPDCGHDNIAGADLCADCGQDLTALDTPGKRSAIETSLTETPVAALTPKAPIFVGPDASVADAVACLKRERVGACLVGSPGGLLGIFSERDLLLRAAHRYDAVRDAPVTELMTAPVETVDAEAPVAYALNLMSVGDFRHLPVMRDGALAGVISLRDVLQFLSDTYPELVRG